MNEYMIFLLILGGQWFDDNGYCRSGTGVRPNNAKRFILIVGEWYGMNGVVSESIHIKRELK